MIYFKQTKIDLIILCIMHLFVIGTNLNFLFNNRWTIEANIVAPCYIYVFGAFAFGLLLCYQRFSSSKYPKGRIYIRLYYIHFDQRTNSNISETLFKKENVFDP